MTCYSPLKAYRGKEVNPKTGKASLVFNHRDGYYDMSVTVPCGQCIGCRLAKSREWAIRCVHESTFHEDNMFLTLTYNEASISETGSLVKDDIVLFLKRLRKAISPTKIRYFQVGEYGGLFGRAHHHALIFGYRFPDLVLAYQKKGLNTYSSKMLDELWGKGYTSVGDLTPDSAAYCARYTLKKVTGKKQKEHYAGKTPEYVTMSRRPGIAAKWAEMWRKECYPSDYIIVGNGIKAKPPKYYDYLFDLQNPGQLDKLKQKRQDAAKQKQNTDCRSWMKEAVAIARVAQKEAFK